MSEAIHQKPAKKSFGKIFIKIYLGIFLLLILVWGIELSRHAIHLYRLARSIQGDPTQIQPDTILSITKDASGDVNAIYRQVSPLFPIFNALDSLPGIGPYLGQIEPLLSYAYGLSRAGHEVVLGLEPLLEDSTAGQATLSLTERATQAMQSGYTHFINAAQAIEQANQVRSRIQPELLPAAVRPLYLKLDNKFNLLLAGIQILQVAPELLGAEQAQNYLVLAQNRDELRATGGFISGIGLLTVQSGKIMQFDLGDSYQIDDFSKPYPKPPEPLKRFMLADYWVTRDANWSPDFPTASQEAQKLYTLSTGVQTQGVIAFNQLVVKKILAVIGPVQVPGTDAPVTAENVEDYMRQAWAPAPEEGLSPEWWLHRKDFMQSLGIVILDKAMSSGTQEQQLNLVKTMVELLDQGQLLIYFNSPIGQAALEDGGWDGGIRPRDGDFLYLVDSNVGFNKVDSIIQRSLNYQVNLTDMDHPSGVVTLTYQHTGSGDQACKQEISYGNGTYQDMQQRCYLDYWRVYSPGGSELRDSNAQTVPADVLLNGLGWTGQVESLPGEGGTQVFAGLLMLPSAQSSQIEVSYSLPARIIQSESTMLNNYALRVQVQPGLEGLPFRLEIKLPDNINPINPDDGWQSFEDQSWVWQGTLDKTTDLHLVIQQPGAQP
jgi:hypothetical protein